MLPALIVGVILIGGCVSVPTRVETQHWTCRAEVYELSTQDGMLYARTSGGIVCLRNGEVRAVREMPARAPEPVVSGSGDGAFLAATARYSGKRVATFWGGEKVFEVLENSLEPLFERPPAEGDYSMLALGSVLFAGTNRGLFVWSGGDWTRVDLGGELPFSRVHGVGKIGREYVVGGISGAALGEPGNWNTISREPVRQVLQVDKDVWIVYGSGALDKLSSDGRLHSDVLHGAAKRPWTSSATASKNGLLLGGLGGWVFKGATFIEKYPQELSGQVVTAIVSNGKQLFVGTQEKGLAQVDGNRIRWINPGTGLADTWVTALCSARGRLYAATATAGLYEIRQGRALKVGTPSEKIRQTMLFNNQIVIGALDGAWKLSGKKWEKLATNSQETTFLSEIDGSMWVGTPTGTYIID
ncbi:MAG: hypothetical protein M3R13_05865 [Armatimonadota bacterium]|nr:hypothetical protein [Armatimonadota bacterium]